MDNIQLWAVKFSSTNATRYVLSICPHPDSHLGLIPTDPAKHGYETIEQLWQVIQTCELVIVRSIEILEEKLEQNAPVVVAQMSEESARKMGFLS